MPTHTPGSTHISVTGHSSTTFGLFLRQLRRRAGLTQGELAALVGFSVSQISLLEKNSRLPNLAMVADHFIPALALNEDPRLAQRLLDLAAAARGERPPKAVITQQVIHTIVDEEEIETRMRLASPYQQVVGREHLLRQITQRLMDAPGRLLTLIGPPGVGKTLLAQTVAMQLADLFAEGAYFVALAATSEAAHVAATIGHALGLAEVTSGKPRERLVSYLRRKDALLILDNFEHLTSAALLISELLNQCPQIRILVTSQEPLRLRSEQRQPVVPLTPAEATELFLMRAQTIDPDFCLAQDEAALVTAICLHLDCLPLAIELIAPQLEFFSLPQLVGQLEDRGLDLLDDGPRDLPPHHQTLRNAIHRSYELLNETEQRLFRTIGLFADGCTVAGLEALLQPQPLGNSEELKSTLLGLVRKSLVQKVSKRGGDRFMLLTTLRAYATEQLIAQDEAPSMRKAYAMYIQQLVEKPSASLGSQALKGWLSLLDDEQENLRQALSWAIDAEPPLATKIALTMIDYWHTRGYDTEASQWLERVLAAHGKETVPRGILLAANANFARRQANYGEAKRLFDEALAILEDANEPHHLCLAYHNLGWFYYDRHDAATTLATFETGLQLARDVDDRPMMATLLADVAYLLAGNPEKQPHAKVSLAESLALLKEIDDPPMLAFVLQQQAAYCIEAEAYADAILLYEDILKIHVAWGNRLGQGWAHALIGEAAWFQGDVTRARMAYEAAMPHFIEMSNNDGLMVIHHHLGQVARRMGQLAEATTEYSKSLNMAHSLQNRHMEARSLAGLGAVALAKAELAEARRYLDAAQEIFEQLAPFLSLIDAAEFAQQKAACERAEAVSMLSCNTTG